MNKNVPSILGFLHKILPLALLEGFAVVISFAISHFFLRGRQLEIQTFFDKASLILSTGRLPETAFYPPLPTFLIYLARLLHLPLSPFGFNLFFLLIGVAVFYFFTQELFHHRWKSFAVVLFGLLNPYFIWLMISSKDTGLEFISVTALAWACWKVLHHWNQKEVFRRTHVWMAGVIALLGLFTTTVRITGLWIAAAFLMWGIVFGKGAIRRLFGVASIIFAVLILLFCAYNQQRVGSFVLTTSGGYNLMIGNDPDYLHAHPHYDLDVFLGTASELPGEVARDHVYRVQAKQYIMNDPIAFLYRLIVKTEWHWFNLEKIPNYTGNFLLDPKTRTVQLHDMDMKMPLLYVLYKIPYLLLFIVSLVFTVTMRPYRRYFFFFLPMLALWPIVALTFPDTRFKISAEILVIPVFWIVPWAAWRYLRQTVDNHADKEP